jgi:hypothetical protein
MAGSSITPEMAVDAALSGKYGQMPVQNAAGQQGMRPFVDYNGQRIYLSHSAVSPMPEKAPAKPTDASGAKPVPANTQSDPRAAMWQQSVDGIRAEQRALAAAIPTMKTPQEQVAASAKITELAKAIHVNAAKAREQGVVVQ